MPTKIWATAAAAIAVSAFLAYYSKESFKNYTLNPSINVAAGNNSDYLSGMPKEITLPRDAKVISVSRSKNGNQVTFETKQSEENLDKLFKDTLVKNGWVLTPNGELSKEHQTFDLLITPSVADGLNVVTLSLLLNL